MTDSATIARVQRDGARSSVVVGDRILAVFQGEYANAVDFANGYNLGRADANRRHGRRLLGLVRRG